jgi:hypothetical protein
MLRISRGQSHDSAVQSRNAAKHASLSPTDAGSFLTCKVRSVQKGGAEAEQESFTLLSLSTQYLSFTQHNTTQSS